MSFELVSSLGTALRAGAAVLVLACALGVSAAPSLAATAGATALASHRAVYDLVLIEADERSAIGQVRGRLVTEFVGDTCDGYTLNMRRVLRIANTGGGTNTFDTVSTSWESGDGDDMRFGSRLYVNGELSETDDLEGVARLGRDGAEGSVTYAKPKQTVLPLPADAVFPVEHSKQILDIARAGETIVRSIVFDGGEVDKIYTAVTFIGARMAPGEVPLPQDAAMAAALADLAAWNVSVSYFEDSQATDSEQLPAYEVRVILFDNGVATELELVYEGFSLRGDLTDLEVFEPGDCE